MKSGYLHKGIVFQAWVGFFQRAINSVLFCQNTCNKSLKSLKDIIINRFIYLGLSPLPVTVANEGLLGSPTKNVIILVVTVTGREDNPIYTTKQYTCIFHHKHPSHDYIYIYRNIFIVITPPKTNIDTQNDGLEKMNPFKYGRV